MTQTRTTAEMDGWFDDPDDPKRFQFYIQCRECTLWTFIKDGKESKIPRGLKCQHCESSRLDSQSLTSERTFDPVRAKKRKIK